MRVSFVEHAALVTLDASAHVGVLERLAGAGIGGGRTYDGLMTACADASHARALLTFNSRHFDPAPGGVTIVEPANSDSPIRVVGLTELAGRQGLEPR